MTASKRYVPVSLVCLLIASTYSATTNPAQAGPSSSLDPYSQVQAPTSKEVEDKNNKARAKKGLPPLNKVQPTNSSTKVEDISSTTTYVTAPGGGNGKAIKQNSTVAESGAGGGKLFGKFPKISLPSLPSLPVLGKGKSKASEQEPEVKVAKAKKDKSTKIAAKQSEPIKAEPVKTVKETPLGEEIETASAASSTDAKPKAVESEGNMVTKTLKATTNGVVNGSKKVGSSIASGAKASGSVLAKGASMVGSGFKAAGEKLKGGTGKVASMGTTRMPNPFDKMNKGGLSASLANGESNLGRSKKPGAANTQSDLLKQSKASAMPSKTSNAPDSDELISEKSLAAAEKGTKGGLAGMSEKMTSTFSKLNPFSKKGIASKKQKQTL